MQTHITIRIEETEGVDVVDLENHFDEAVMSIPSTAIAHISGGWDIKIRETT